MAAQKKRATTAKRSGKIMRSRPVPRMNPRNGPPLYFPSDPGTIPFEKIEAAVEAVLAARGKLAVRRKTK